MRNFIELTEAKGQIVFAFGRFNPPTTGHEKLISKVAQVSGSSPYRIYPSFSQNPKKDPLPHTLKVAYMRKMFPKHARSIVADKDAKTAINVAVKLYDEGFRDLVMVAGSDRVKEFSSLLKTYNGFEGKRHGFYKFDRIDVVSAGERDPDAEGVEGMSASKMRAAAVDGDFDSFQQGLPKGFRDAKKLYNDVRKYMGIREERHMGEMDEHEAVRDAYLTGKIWNVGDIVEAKGVSGKVIRKGTNYIAFHDEEGKVHKAWLHEIELDEKYDSDKFFGGKGTPAQRTQLLKLQTKALKAFPSSPKQKEIQKEIQALRKKMGMKVKEEVELGERTLTSTEKEKLKSLEKKVPMKDFIDRYGKEGESIYYATLTKMAKKESIDESPITGILRKINQMRNPKQYDAIVKAYVKSRKDDTNKTPAFVLDKLARQYGGIDVKALIDYINKLVKKGVLPADLRASRYEESVVEQWYESDTIRDSYQDKYGDDWWWKLNEVHDKMLEKLGSCGEDCAMEEENTTKSFTNFRKTNDWGEVFEKAEYDGRPVKLNNPTRGDVKKYKVYVRNDKGNVVKVEFGDPNMEIKRDDPARRKSFRARHNCDNPGPKYKARYWSCKFWEKGKSVTDLMKG